MARKNKVLIMHDAKKEKFPEIVGTDTSSPFILSRTEIKPMVDKKIKPKVHTDTIKLTLKSVGRVYKSEGKTLEEALNKLQISGGAKAVSVLTAERGDRRVEKLINGNLSQRLFGKASPTMRMIALKRMHDIFDL